MNVEITKLPESRVALQIEMAPPEVELALDRTFKQLVQRVTVPGFRKGKAPRSVVERLVGEEFFLHEATEEAIRWGYRKAVDQEHINPIDEADIQPVEGHHEHVRPGESFHFEASVAVKPEVQLPDYHSLRVAREIVEVVDADIDRVLHDLQERTATLEPVTRPAQLTDTVTLNVTGRVEGEEVLNREDMEFPLQDVESDSHSALPGLSAELVGVNRGEIREIALPLPDGYPEEALAGKTMFLRALVKEIKRRVLPELDDDFAKTLSDAETLDELRGRLRANLEAERRREADEKLVNAAIEQVSERTFLEIPPVLVDEELDRMVKDVRASFERSQYSFEHYLEAAHTTEEAMRDEYREGATQNVKTSLVVGAVADLENIDISNAEVTAALEEILRTSKMSVGEQRRLRQSNSVRSNIRGRIRRQRAIQQLVAVMTDGEEVGSEAADALVDQTADPSADTQETIAVEVGG